MLPFNLPMEEKMADKEADQVVLTFVKMLNISSKTREFNKKGYELTDLKQDVQTTYWVLVFTKK